MNTIKNRLRKLYPAAPSIRLKKFVNYLVLINILAPVVFWLLYSQSVDYYRIEGISTSFTLFSLLLPFIMHFAYRTWGFMFGGLISTGLGVVSYLLQEEFATRCWDMCGIEYFFISGIGILSILIGIIIGLIKSYINRKQTDIVIEKAEIPK